MITPLAQRPLGDTDLNVSVLALGTVKFGRNTAVKYPRPFDLPSDAALTRLLDEARALGINLLDTAPAYGSSEARLGTLLKDQRQHWLLCSKVGESFDGAQSRYDFRPESVTPSLQASLSRLDTDYLDVALIHSDGNDLEILNRWGTLDALLEAKRAGLVRAVGMSHKSEAGGYRALALGADLLMTELSSDVRDMQSLIAHCAAQRKGVLVKKALGSGHAAIESLRFVAGCTGVTSIVVGTLNPAHLRENARLINAALSAGD